MDLVKSMRVFVKVVDAGSLTGGAERSGISVAMASNHIKYLEKDLSCKLLNRTTRVQTTTDFGKFYYDKCLSILRILDDIEANAHALSTDEGGIIRVTVPRVFGLTQFVPKLKEFHLKYPKIELEISLTDTLLNLKESGIDVAIRIGELPDSDLIAKPLAPYRILLCASPDYVARRGAPTHPDDLEKHDCIALIFSWSSEWRSYSRQWHFTSGEDSLSAQINARLRIGDAAAVRQCVIDGLGIAILPELLVLDDLAAGRIVRVMPDWGIPTRSMTLLYERHLKMSARLRAFVDFVADNFGRGGGLS